MSRAPRVLLSGIALAQPMSGVRRQANELWPRVARELIENGGAFDVLAPAEGLPADLDARLPSECQRIATSVPAGGPLARGLREGHALRAALRRGTYDLWHTGHFPAPFATRLPFTCLIHDLRNLSTLVSPFKRALAKQTLKSAFRRATHVVTVSEAMRVELHHHFPRLKITAISHGADHLPVLARGPAPNAPILFFGHLEKRRNPELLLHALAADASLPNVRFAGTAKGDQAERLDALAHKLGVANRIQITGPVAEADLPALLAAAACLVLPSRIEGFGIPAIEALRAGLPLAIADSPALREVAPKSTPHFPADDPRACAAAIHAALNQDQATINAAQTYAERFSWNHSATRWIELWQSLLT
jgi:glycosyltransferase involved in cell wall biosynthesis